MKKSGNVQVLDEVQDLLSSEFKNFGFRKKGRTYNRRFSEGLFHVVNFQMGRYPVQQSQQAGVDKSLYGSFTVNLGICLPYVLEIEYPDKPKKFYHEYDCQIRTRLGSLLGEGSDLWWDLNQTPGDLSDTVSSLIFTGGLPFLEKFTSNESVVEYYRKHGDLPFNNPWRSALIVGIVLSGLGKIQAAEAHFDNAVNQSSGHPGFRTYVQDIRVRCITGSQAD